MKKALIVIIIIIIILSFSKLQQNDKDPIRSVTKSSTVSVRLKWLNQAQFAGLYVALDKKYYDDRGLDVTLKERDFALEKPVDEVVAGKADFAIVSPEELLIARSEGKKVKAVAAFFQDTPAILISLERNLIRSPRDFSGKKIGIVTDSSESRFIVKDLLKQFQIPEQEVKYVVVGSDQIESLIRGDVDIILLYRTSGFARLNNRGHDYVFIKPEEYGLISYNDVLVVSESLIKEKPELVRGFVEASIAGWTYALTNEAETITISHKYSNEKYRNREVLQSILRQSNRLVKPSAEHKIGAMDSLKWRILLNKLNSQNIITEEIKINDMYTNEFLPKAE